MIVAGERKPEGRVDTFASPGRSIMPPYVVVSNFLEERLVPELLDLVVAHEAAFRPSPSSSGINPSVRKSMSMGDIQYFGRMLRAKLREMVPTFLRELGMAPIAEPRIEPQVVAHGDGDFFTRHIDTLTEEHRIEKGVEGYQPIRVISAIYYFHARPKAFTGGELRLHAIGDPQAERFVDIEPEYNALVVFPAWAPHEVRPICCPSGRFADSRFAVNLFVSVEREAKPGAADASG